MSLPSAQATLLAVQALRTEFRARQDPEESVTPGFFHWRENPIWLEAAARILRHGLAQREQSKGTEVFTSRDAEYWLHQHSADEAHQTTWRNTIDIARKALTDLTSIGALVKNIDDPRRGHGNTQTYSPRISTAELVQDITAALARGVPLLPAAHLARQKAARVFDDVKTKRSEAGWVGFKPSEFTTRWLLNDLAEKTGSRVETRELHDRLLGAAVADIASNCFSPPAVLYRDQAGAGEHRHVDGERLQALGLTPPGATQGEGPSLRPDTILWDEKRGFLYIIDAYRSSGEMTAVRAHWLLEKIAGKARPQVKRIQLVTAFATAKEERQAYDRLSGAIDLGTGTIASYSWCLERAHAYYAGKSLLGGGPFEVGSATHPVALERGEGREKHKLAPRLRRLAAPQASPRRTGR